MSLLKNIYKNGGFHKKPETTDSNGDVVTKEYYKSYDAGYLGLRVRETLVHTRGADGLPVKTTKTINFYSSGGDVKDTNVVELHYSAISGYAENKKSRSRLIDNASMWIFGDLVAEYGATTGEAHAKEFLKDLKDDFSTYKGGNKDDLVASINASVRSYITQTRKDTLTSILNIEYGA
jgi:hypothetical protein